MGAPSNKFKNTLTANTATPFVGGFNVLGTNF
jgi:hypothetical protein